MRSRFWLLLLAWLFSTPLGADQLKWTATVDGATPAKHYGGGPAAIQFAGVFDGATIAIEASGIDDAWSSLYCLFDGAAQQEALAAISEPGWCRTVLPRGLMRLNVIGAGASTDVEVAVIDLPRLAMALAANPFSGGRLRCPAPATSVIHVGETDGEMVFECLSVQHVVPVAVDDGRLCRVNLKVCDEAYCSSICPCSEGQGDCDDDTECQDGLVCALDSGGLSGCPSLVDICIPPS